MQTGKGREHGDQRDCRWVVGCLFAALLAVGSPARGAETAATGGQSAKPEELEAVRVTAAPLNDPVKDQLTPAPSQALATEVINREDLEWQKPVSAMDALNYTPSMQVTRKGRKNDYNLTLRAGESVNVLMDGMNLSSLQDYRFLHYTPPSLIEEIRVVRDSSSLIYGPPQLGGTTTGNSYGYGGVVDFRLREPTTETQGEVRTEVSRYWSNLETLSLSGPMGDRLGYVFGATHNYQGSPGGENLSRDLRNVLGRVSYGYLPGSKLSLSVMDENGWRKLQRAHPPAAVATQNQTWEYDPTRTTLTTLQAHHAWSDEVSTEVGAYYRYMTATLQQYENGLERDNREDKRGVFLRQAVQFPEVNTVRVGGELAQWRNPTGKLYYEDHARDEKYYSLFAQDELKVIPERLTLDAGVRWDRTYINKGFTQSSSVNQAGVNPGGIEIRDVRRDPAVSYSTGAKFDLTHSQSLTARYSVSQMSTDSSIVSTKNTALPDARETREELGYQIRFQEPKLTLGLVGFMSQIDNGVIYSGHKVINGIDTGIYASNDFTRMGLELSAEGALVGGLSYFFTGTWIDPRNDTLGAFQNTMPRYMLAAGLGYQVRGWKAAVYAKNVPPYDDNSFTGGPYAEIGDYYQVDANLSYTIHAAGTLEHEIYGGVRNLANQHYETVVGYPDPGIWPYIGYILRF